VTDITETNEPEEEQEEVMYCQVHPNIPATLRCNKCGRPMCTRCIVRTPVGYRCKQCVYQQQNVYFNSVGRDYWVAGVVAFVMSALLGGFLLMFNYLLVTLFLSAPVGGVVSEVVFRAVGKRRGRHTWVVVGLATAAGVLPVLLLRLVGGHMFLADWLNPLIYLALAAGAASTRFRHGRPV
jgi:hypothetical protein